MDITARRVRYFRLMLNYPCESKVPGDLSFILSFLLEKQFDSELAPSGDYLTSALSGHTQHQPEMDDADKGLESGAQSFYYPVRGTDAAALMNSVYTKFRTPPAKSTIAKGNENETNHIYRTMDIFHAAQLFDKPVDQCSRRHE